MKKVVITYGVYSGLVVSLALIVSIMLYKANPAMHVESSAMVIGYLSMLLGFSMIFIAIKKYRDNHSNGVISFGKAFRVGIIITLIASLFYVITWAILYRYYVPDFLDQYAELTLAKMKTTASSEEIQAATTQMETYKAMYKNPFMFTLLTLAEIFPVGLLVSLVAGFVMKRRAAEAQLN